MKGSVVTIGNFDGLHAGHRRIMNQVVVIARKNGWTPTVLTFHPHPTRLVAPARAPKLMTTPEQRSEMMLEEGIENVLILPFTREVAGLTPEEFVKTVLCEQLNARVVLVGANFRFGKGQAGNVQTLAELGVRYGFTTEVLDEVSRRGGVVSSSGIRTLIERGNVSAACRLLTTPYAIEGEIVTGLGIGAKQTVPTLNLNTTAELLPASGVYITRTSEAGRQWDSITNIGYRPTFNGDSLTIETYLLSAFDGEPPHRIKLEFLRRVREERKFESPDALKSQIFKDVSRAQTYFRRLAAIRDKRA